MELLKCERCGYEWPQKGDKKPKRCARCNSLYWEKPLTPYWKHVREKNKENSKLS